MDIITWRMGPQLVLPWKLTWQAGKNNHEWVDVFPIENGEFSNVMLVFRGVFVSFTPNLGEVHNRIWLRPPKGGFTKHQILIVTLVFRGVSGWAPHLQAMKFGHLEGVPQPLLGGLTITMVINHLPNGMIL